MPAINSASYLCQGIASLSKGPILAAEVIRFCFLLPALLPPLHAVVQGQP